MVRAVISDLVDKCIVFLLICQMVPWGYSFLPGKYVKVSSA